MKFRCARCGTNITVTAEILREEAGATVQCPSCGARYRRRRKNPVSASSTSTTGTTPGQGLTVDATVAAATLPPANPTLVTTSPLPGATSQAPAEGATSPPSTGRVSRPAVAADGAGATSTRQAAARARRRSSFVADELVAKRYRILRFVAKGGMGEVYEAEDLELRERVALKTVRAKAASSTATIERFKREIQLARKVTHPNVCRIFDVGRHEYSDPDTPDVLLLTMEMLPGTTLAQRLRQHGPLDPDDALPLVRQMGEALAAAHAAGIVHRDFKSDNVMLVPGTEGPRAVVTDFGVARAASDQRQAVKVSSSADIVGTPAYMAPEQVSGGEITSAADIYAFGVVIFEMLTGKVPFAADTPLATAALRLTHAPPSPRVLLPDLDQRWEEAVLRCLEREPEKRFGGDAREVARFLAREDQASLAQVAEQERKAREAEKRRAIEDERRRTLAEEQAKQQEQEVVRARTHRLRVALAFLLVLASGYLVYSRIEQKLTENPYLAGFPTDSIRARHSIAVLGFRNVSGRPELAWLSTALAEMLRTELAGGGELRMIPGENVARMKVELELADVDSLATDTLRRIHDNLGTDFVVMGSYVALPGGALRLDLRLQDASSGETLTALAENGTEAELFDLVARAGEQLKAQLDVESAADGRQLATPLPTDPEAARLYAEGLDRLRQFDPLAARELLSQAAVAEPANALVQSALSSALAALGDSEESLEAAKRAYDLSSELPEEERLGVEGRYREAAEHWDRAAQIYERLWRAFPDNLEYGLRHAAALNAAGRGEQALATVDVLRRLPPPASSDPRVDLAEASAAVTLAQFPRQRDAAARAAEKAQALDAVLLVARARVTEAEALRELGDSEAARPAVLEARRIYEETGNRAGQALALAEEANIQFAAGDYTAALELYELSRSTCAEMGDQGCVMRAMNNVAVVKRNQGELDDARAQYEELLALARQLGSEIAQVSALNNLGAVLFSEGQLSESRRRFEESLELGRRTGRRSVEALALSNIGAVLRAQGSLEEAQRLHQQALDIRRDIGQLAGQIASLNSMGRVALDRGLLDEAEGFFGQALDMASEIGSQSLRAAALHNLGEVAAERAAPAEARGRYEEALRIRRQLGERRNVARTNLSLASLALLERTPERAVSLTERLADEYERDAARDDETQARILLSRASLELGDRDRARRAIDRASQLVGRSEKRLLDLGVRIQRARVLAAEGDYAEAARNLQTALDQAESSGLVALQLEARLAGGEVDAGQGNRDAAREQLTGVAREARERGFRDIARRATDAAAR